MQRNNKKERTKMKKDIRTKTIMYKNAKLEVTSDGRIL